MPPTEEDEVTQTLVLDRFDKSLRVGIAVWAPRWDLDAFNALDLGRTRWLEDSLERVSEQWISVVNQVARITQNAIDGIGEIASDLFHPLAIGIDSNTSDLDGTSPKLHHEKDRVANSAEDPQDFDSEEITGAEAVPMGAYKLFPSPFLVALGSGNDVGFIKDIGDGSTADVCAKPDVSRKRS